jgi:hypothetical protein
MLFFHSYGTDKTEHLFYDKLKYFQHISVLISIVIHLRLPHRRSRSPREGDGDEDEDEERKDQEAS